MGDLSGIQHSIDELAEQIEALTPAGTHARVASTPTDAAAVDPTVASSHSDARLSLHTLDEGKPDSLQRPSDTSAVNPDAAPGGIPQCACKIPPVVHSRYNAPTWFAWCFTVVRGQLPVRTWCRFLNTHTRGQLLFRARLARARFARDHNIRVADRCAVQVSQSRPPATMWRRGTRGRF